MRQTHGRYISLQWLVMVLGAVVLIAVLVYDRFREKDTIIAGEQARLLTQTRVINENLSRQMAATDATLRGIRDLLPSLSGLGPEAVGRYLSLLCNAIPGVRTLIVVNAQGRIVSSNRPELIGADVTHRAYFQEAKNNHGADRLILSEPLRTLLGAWSLFMVRGITGLDSGFNGLVAANLDPDYFKTLLGSVNYAPDMRSTVVHGLGTVFYTMPEMENLVGKNLSQSGSFLARHLENGGKENTFVGTAMATGDERLFALNTVKPESLSLDHSLVVSLSRSYEAVMASWRRDTLVRVLLAAGLLAVWATALAVLHLRQRVSLGRIEQANAKARESARRLNLATSSSRIGVFEYDLASDHLDWDDSMFTIYGVSRDAFSSSYEAWSKSVVPEDRMPAETALAKSIETGQPFDTEFRIRRGDGEVRVIRAIAQMERDSSGKTVRLAGINEDVTERAVAEERLRQRERDLTSIMDNLPSMIGYWDKDLRCRFGNKAYHEWFGIDADTMPGMELRELQGETLFAKNRPYIDAALRGEPQLFERSIPTPDGLGMKHSLAHYIPDIQDGKVQGFYVLVSDITSVKAAQEALRESEGRFRNLFEQTAEALLLFEDMTFVDCNPSALTMLGMSGKDELVGKTPMVISPSIQPGGRSSEDLAGEYVAEALEKGSKLFEWMHRRVSGEDFLVEVSLSRISATGHPQLLVSWRDITARKRTEQMLARLAAIVESSQDAIIGVDLAGDIVSWNPAAERLFGYGAAEAVGHSQSMLFPEAIKTEEAGILARIASGESVATYRSLRLRKNGQIFPAALSISPIRDAAQGIVGVSKIVRDVSEAVLAEENQRLAETVFDNSIEGIVVTDASANIQRVNAAFTHITGYAPEEAIGQNPRILKSGHHPQTFYEDMWSSILGKGQWSGEIWNRRKSGDIYPEWLTINAIRDQGGLVTHFISVFHDITETKRQQEAIEYQAYHDALTGLPNRILCLDRLAMALAKDRRNAKKTAVLFLDLDNFKGINDSLGHASGDQFLQEVASRLSSCLREVDTLSRLGGDEFVIILPNITGPDDASHVCRRVFETLRTPVNLRGVEAYVSVSIGVVVAPDDGTVQDTLLKNADIAMYRAKRAGKNNFQFFTTGMDHTAKHHLLLETKLRKALEKNAFEIHYQPIVEVRSGRISGAEALVRWNDGGTMVPPGDFIPLAEETGLILPLGDFVLDAAARQVMAWNENLAKPMTMAVNISSKQFSPANFAQMLEAVRALEIPPGVLHMEITESVLMSSLDAVTPGLNRLKELGVHIMLDDFGTGYSSLSYLRRLPLDGFKIDRSFIKDAHVNRDSQAVALAIISLAGVLGLEVVAEGVEFADQRELLLQAGCDLLQGYLAARPVPAGEFEKLLAQGTLLPPR